MTAAIAETISAVETALIANDAIKVIGRLDHQANALKADLSLGPNELIFFGNPVLGTPLMQQNQQTGIDLPQKIHACENPAGQVQLSYDGAGYLQQRHGLSADTPQLAIIDKGLKGLAEGASATTVSAADASTVATGEGIVVVASNQTMAETYTALIKAINDTGTLGIFREVDHGANATAAGLELGPTRLVMFGNPAVGTPLMVSQPTSGIDLPLKALVYEDAGQNVFIVYNDPSYIAKRHGITDQAERINNITKNLAGLAAAAAGN